MPRAILFGFEGGLVDPVGPRFEVLTSVLAEEGVEPRDEDLEACPFAAPYEEWLGAVIERVRGRPEPALAARLMARAAARYRARAKEQGPPWLPGAVELVERAAADGLALGIVSGLSNAEVERALTASNLSDRFRFVVGAEDLEDGGTRSDAYRQALARLNSEPPLPERLIHPHEVAAIESGREGVRAAAAAGLITVAVGGGVDVPEEADRVVASLADVRIEELDSR